MRGGVDDVDDTTRPHPLDPAEADQPGHRDGIGQATGLHDDRVKGQPGIGELLQRLVQPVVVVQAADTAAGDRDGFVDLAGDQSSVDVDVAEVVDDDTDPCARGAKHVVEQAGLACAEVSRQRDDGDGAHRGSLGESVRSNG